MQSYRQIFSPSRNFRHSAIFVRADSDIEKPEDLLGKAAGEFALWGHNPGVRMKGILADEFGVTPDQCTWVIGRTNFPIPAFGWVPQPVPENVEALHAGDVEKNRPAIDSILRFAHEQGLVKELLICDDIFVPSLTVT